MPLPAWLRLGALERLDHTTLSAGTAGGAMLLALGAIQIFGDPHAAGPHRIVALDESGAGAFRTPLSKVVLDPASASAAAAALQEQYGASSEPLPAMGEAGTGQDESANPIPAASPLPRAPFAKLTARGPLGPLPVIAPDGTTPLKAYRRPFAGDPNKPRIAVIVGGLGFNAATTRAAIEELPAEVTLSFVPYADHLQNWIDSARAHGHEVMIELPMESFDSAESDSGPQTLLANAPARDNLGKLENLLSRGAGYFAVSNYQGSKFAQSAAASAVLVKALKDRGLGFVSNGIGQRAALGFEAQRTGLPFAAADRVLDAQREAAAIDDQLSDLEALAQQTGSALGAGFGFPVTVGEVKAWAASLADKGLALAPASAVMEARSSRR
jgi:polysaccharide deacetylase 2 family uncharacterized protein YibQ